MIHRKYKGSVILYANKHDNVDSSLRRIQVHEGEWNEWAIANDIGISSGSNYPEYMESKRYTELTRKLYHEVQKKDEFLDRNHL